MPKSLHSTYQISRHVLMALFLLIFLVLEGAPRTANAQFIYFSMEVESESSASQIERLDFGAQTLGSGRTRIGLGQQGMGVFMLRGLRYQVWNIEMEAPEILQHAGSPDDTIPLNLKLAFNNRGTNNSSAAIQPDNSEANVVLLGQNHTTNQSLSDYFNSEWARVYLYIYGWVDIGNVPSGVYRNHAIIRIEY